MSETIYKPYKPAETYEGKPCVTCELTTRYAKTKRCVACWLKKRAEYEQRPEVKEKKRQYLKLHPRTFERSKETGLMYKYNLTMEEWRRLNFLQKGLCAICSKPLDKPYVDHNHVTNKVRGLLCQTCNTGIGMFDDNVMWLRNAITYLETS